MNIIEALWTADPTVYFVVSHVAAAKSRQVIGKGGDPFQRQVSLEGAYELKNTNHHLILGLMNQFIRRFWGLWW